ncbi:hypothetical protein B0O80DRAFT_503036 [Mortierella sp. GBAus27b]|nr:hypothetical protein B0O80DRAFT_503036 [Mortierella sp. GBAus27b]
MNVYRNFHRCVERPGPITGIILAQDSGGCQTVAAARSLPVGTSATDILKFGSGSVWPAHGKCPFEEPLGSHLGAYQEVVSRHYRSSFDLVSIPGFYRPHFLVGPSTSRALVVNATLLKAPKNQEEFTGHEDTDISASPEGMLTMINEHVRFLDRVRNLRDSNISKLPLANVLDFRYWNGTHDVSPRSR